MLLAFGAVVSAAVSVWSLVTSSTTVSLLSANCSLSFAVSSGSRGGFTAGSYAEPSEAMLIRVVVALAGRDLLDAPSFRVNRREGCRLCFGRSSSCDVEEEAMLEGGTFLATDMLSRATSVTGAALEAPKPGYQF